ncbi:MULTISPECIES: amidase domain-containing protein [unclassified Streptomyces]|uniref:amidase domain-containing protein n=1 Tax=unclassified Streptomyces TaxID=2593676 RepID=UPI001BED26FE|nr:MULTISPECIES: amidase domain-containing protein [unclassified Streptomyces]MBT2406843.1 amidase domain-containing protein [Streptomyces sp. ISL-21]MBT2613532.1 amidase domain-containing protein [Streptomyces sp. ISL-87]
MISTTFRPAVGVALTTVISSAFLPVTSASAAPRPHAADSAAVSTFARIADDVLSRRTEALVEEGPKHRTSAPASAKTRMSPQLRRDEDAALSSLRSRKTRLRDLGEAYTDADTRVTVDTATVTNGRATVQVTEDTTLTYKKLRGDEPATTGFRTRYELNLVGKSGGAWELTSIKSQDSGPVAVNEPTAAKAYAIEDDGQTYPDGTPASTKYPAPAYPKVKTGTGYDYAAMATYAEKYWKNYNPAYRSFNQAGGDCTNFISQSLKAGGWKNVPGATSDYRNWWYDGSLQTNSWVGANDWAWFTLSNERAANLANVYQMDVGDILQVDFDRDGSKDHSMIVTYRSSAGIPYVTYHSTNTYRKSLASLVASYPNAVYFAYRT